MFSSSLKQEIGERKENQAPQEKLPPHYVAIKQKYIRSLNLFSYPFPVTLYLKRESIKTESMYELSYETDPALKARYLKNQK